jgi:HlyD family secretion protein
VIGVDNRDMALLPGMTANLQIVTDERRNVLRIPNAALRFRPPGASPPAPAVAPAPTAANDGSRQARGGGRPFQELRQRLAEEVRPTPEQSAAIDRIFSEARSGFPVREPGLSGDERRDAMRKFRRDIQDKIGAALDPDRRAKYLAMVDDTQQSGGARSDSGSPGRVYVMGNDGAPIAVALRLGVTDGSYTEVLAGDLREGTGVVVGGGPRSQGSEPAPSRPRGPRLF